MASKNSIKTVTQQNVKKTAKSRLKSTNRLALNPVVKALIRKIVKGASEPDDKTRKLSEDLKQLKTLVEAQQLQGGKTWFEWARKAFRKLDINQMRLLNDLAGAPDEQHRAILMAHRADGAKRTRRWRGRLKAEANQAKRMAIERQWIIRWAKAGPHAQVIRAWKHIKETYDA